MEILWVSMAFYSGRLTLWLIIVRLIMIDDGYPRMTAAGEQRWRHYYNSRGIDTMVSPKDWIVVSINNIYLNLPSNRIPAARRQGVGKGCANVLRIVCTLAGGG